MIFTKGIDPGSPTPLYQQVIDSIITAIQLKKLGKGDALPSVNQICGELKVSQGTVFKAYEELRKKGIIDSRQGKAFYIINENISNKLSIFVLVDRVTQYKEILYNTFIDSFERDVTIDFNFYNYDLLKFEKLIDTNLGYYNYYVIMPHFNEDVSPILSRIPADKLILLNQFVPKLNGKFSAVYQNFEKDVYQSISQAYPLLVKYKSLTLVLESKNRFQFIPKEIRESFVKVCSELKIRHSIADSLDTGKVTSGNAYFIIADSDLVEILKYTELQQWKLGTDIGILAYDDTPLREILRGGITVMSTDFRQMGLTTARLIKENSKEIIENPCSLIVRNSL